MWFRFDPLSAPVGLPTLDASELATAFLASSARFLGAGTFGESWAIHGATGTTVAKVFLDSPMRSDILAREIEPLRRVASPNVVRLEGTSLVSLTVGQRFVLTLEYIEGGDLMARIRANRWPTTLETQAFMVAAVRGLLALHEAEVVHRDLKPENLAFRGDAWAEPVILDLGLGRLLDASTRTLYPQAVGTAPYMAPEVVEGRPAGKGSDLWSLGVVGYLLLTRRHPFLPDPTEVLDEAEMLARITKGAPALPAAVPEPLRTVITRMLSVRRYERGSASRALSDLEDA